MRGFSWRKGLGRLMGRITSELVSMVIEAAGYSITHTLTCWIHVEKNATTLNGCVAKRSDRTCCTGSWKMVQRANHAILDNRIIGDMVEVTTYFRLFCARACSILPRYSVQDTLA